MRRSRKLPTSAPLRASHGRAAPTASGSNPTSTLFSSRSSSMTGTIDAGAKTQRRRSASAALRFPRHSCGIFSGPQCRARHISSPEKTHVTCVPVAIAERQMDMDHSRRRKPAGRPFFSIRTVSAPRRAATTAPGTPAVPPPTTATNYACSRCVTFSKRFPDRHSAVFARLEPWAVPHGFFRIAPGKKPFRFLRKERHRRHSRLYPGRSGIPRG